MNKQNIKIIFFGTSDFAVPTLEALIKNGYEIITVVTTPDEPTGRKQILTPSPVKIAAQKLELDILQPQELRGNNDFFKLLTTNYPLLTLGIVAAYGKIISAEVINIPEHGLLNIHPSLLPKYRGPTPIQSAILNGEKKTGITIIKIDEEVDHGPIIGSRVQGIGSSEKYEELETKLAKSGAELLIKILPDYLTGKVKLVEQDHDQATFTKKFTREDARVNWNRTAEEIDCQIRALNPEPGTWTTWNGKVLKILEAKIQTLAAIGHNRGELQLAGQIFLENEEIAVRTASDNIVLKTIQLESKKAISAEDFVRGNLGFIGTILK